jgi:BRO family, N-terminal domain protein
MENIENGIRILRFENNKIKIRVINSDLYFNLEDVCKILNIKDTKRAKAKLDKQGIHIVFDVMPKDFISEPNLYRLISHSRRLANIDFVIWLASEVLPTFTRNKIAKKLIKDLEKLRNKEFENL